jgi:hypothetical protein
VRDQIAVLADLIIPSAPGMPSASEIGVHSRYIDIALQARPDRVETLTAVLRHLADNETPDLDGIDDSLLEPVIQLVIVCYFMSPMARRSIDYPGQLAIQIAEGESEYYLEEGNILEPVVSRGPIWRRFEEDR